MIHRMIVCFSAISLLSTAPSGAEPAFLPDEARLAFAEGITPRGIKLSDGADSDEPKPADAQAPVKFADPFVDIDPALDGRSIEELISGTPLFAPIEGLPEAVWKEKACSTCHAWTQETLCTQGEFYVKQGLGAVDRKQHPYGGMFKKEVMEWARRGCE